MTNLAALMSNYSLSLSAHTTRQKPAYICFLQGKTDFITVLSAKFHCIPQQAKNMPNDQYFNEASTSGCNKHLLQLRRTSTSSRAVAENSSNFNHWKREPEIEQLGERLKILEEEAEMLKEALLESVEESRTMITDINLHFKTIQSCLLQRGPDRVESNSHGNQIVKVQLCIYLFTFSLPFEAHKRQRQGEGGQEPNIETIRGTNVYGKCKLRLALHSVLW